MERDEAWYRRFGRGSCCRDDEYMMGSIGTDD